MPAKGGRVTRGHRFLRPAKKLSLRLVNICQTGSQLCDSHKFRPRRGGWSGGNLRDRRGGGGQVTEDDELLEEGTSLEYPTALSGDIPAAYLEMPTEVIITPCADTSANSRMGPTGGCCPSSLLYATALADLDIVRQGNEKVLRAGWKTPLLLS
jgi:glycyl-tRNA synthetase beta subunit